MDYKVGIKIDGEAGGAVAAAQATGAALDTVDVGLQKVNKATVATTAEVRAHGEELKRQERTLKDVERAHAATGATATKAQGKQMFQQQQLGYQLNDFFVQVSSGQSPMTALIQQGSQLSGTFGGIGNATRAVLGLLTPTVLGFGALAGAAGAVGYAMFEGAAQSREFNKSLVLTGNYAGVTAGQLDGMAQRVSAAMGTTIGGVRETLGALVATGRFTGAALEPVGAAIEKVTALTGQSREDVVKNFTAMANDGAVKFAERANASYHFLSLAQYRHIALLEEQGRSTEAMRVTSEALNAHMGGLSVNLGIVERSWRALRGAASGAWDAMLGVGREQTIEGQIAIAQGRQQAFANLIKDPSADARKTARGEGAEGQLETLNKTKFLQERIKQDKADQAQLAERQIVAEKSVNKVLEEGLSKSEQKTKALKKFREDAELTGRSKTDVAKGEAAISDKFKEKGSGAGDGAAKVKALAEAEYSARRAALEKIAGLETSVVAAQQQANEYAYKAGLVGLRDYYTQKTTLELASLAVQEKLIAAELAQATITRAKVTRPEDKLNTQAKITQLETQLQQLGIKKSSVALDNTNARALALKAELDQLEQRLEADDAKAKLAVFNQQVAGRDRTEVGRLDLIKDPQAREAAQLELRMAKQRDVIGRASTLTNDERLSAERQLNDELALENALLAEKFKPGWVKLAEEWGNTTKLIKDSYDASMGNMLKAGEDAFVRSSGNIVDTGRAMLKQLEQDLLRLAYQNLMGQILGSGSGGGSGSSTLFGTVLRSLFSFDGGGYTGDGARSGGLDGKGGFMALLHPRESVTDHTLTASGGGGAVGVTLNVINQTGQQFEATQRPGVDGKSVDLLLTMAKRAMAEDIANGSGEVTSALQQRYGLRTNVA